MRLLHYYWMQIHFVAIFWSIFASFSPDIQWRVTFLTVLLLLVLILWKKTIKQSRLTTFGKKIEGNTKKRPKWPNFKDIWNIKAKFGENKFKKYIKVYISFKATLSAFHCFLFHKNIPNTFEVIALLLKADTIFDNFLVNFCLV